MSFLMRQLARYVVQKAASDPEARDKVIRAARTVVVEATRIVRKDDRAYQVGRALRRGLDKLQDKR